MIFLLDVSGSIYYDQFMDIRDFVAKIVSRVESSSESVRVGVITFDHKVRQVIQLTAYTGTFMQDLDDVVQNLIYYGGFTDIGVAMQRMLDMFNNP